MKRPNDRFPARALIAVALTLTASGPLFAQEAEEEPRQLGWSDAAELTLVSTGGNAETQTFGFKNTLIYRWQEGELTIAAGGLRSESTVVSRTAVETPDGGLDFREDSETSLTAEQFYLRGRYDRPISERLFWFAGAGWERNEFAGIRNRYSLVGGIGQIWFETETARFRTDYGLTYTDQEDLIVDPLLDDAFLGLRLSWDYWRQLTASTTVGSVLILDENLDETSDYRADFLNWVAVAMSERLALRVSLEFLFDNEPALVEVPIVSADGLPTGATAAAELDDLDHILSVALVVSF